jgi:hypothetical protein
MRHDFGKRSSTNPACWGRRRVLMSRGIAVSREPWTIGPEPACKFDRASSRGPSGVDQPEASRSRWRTPPLDGGRLARFERRVVIRGDTVSGMTAKGGAAAFGLAWLLVGLVVWGVGAFGIARGLEDHCLHVADDRDYGASSATASIWPPDLTCELAGPDDASAADPLEVMQLSVALLRTGWILGFPVAWIALGTVVALRCPWTRQRLTRPADHREGQSAKVPSRWRTRRSDDV